MITYDQIKDFVNNTDCVLLDANEGLQSKIRVKCSCGREFNTTFARFKYYNKRKCDVCSGHHNDKRYVEEYLKQYGATLLTDEYLNSSQMLDIRCSCGNKFQTTFAKVKSKNKVYCNNCTIGRNNSSHLTESEIDELLSFAQLTLLSEYKDTSSKCKFRCRCGKEFSRTLNKVQCGQHLCNSCASKSSKIEILTSEFLLSKNINFEEQFMFSNLKTRNNVYLRFDFAIFDNAKNLLCLIELDGSQHYEPVEAWGGQKGFERRQMLDETKNKYCETHNIKLYRIPYWNFNKINEELENILNMTILCQAS